MEPTNLFSAFLDAYNTNLDFVSQAIRLTYPPEPTWGTPNKIVLDLSTVFLRDFTTVNDGSTPVLIVSPYAGNYSTLMDYAPGQSLVETFLANGTTRVFSTDWKNATSEMKNFDIDNYLSDLLTMVDYLGGRAHLVGACQGGWLSAMFTALYPEKAASLVIVGSPIDTDAGDGELKKMAHKTPISTFEFMIAKGDGLMLGTDMLAAWKGMKPEQQVTKYFDLYNQVVDHADGDIENRLLFARWYENTMNLPGKFHLQVVDQLFKRNLLFKGEFIGLGRKISLGDITCPVHLVAAVKDDIAPMEQLLNAKQVLTGCEVTETITPGGHIALFVSRGMFKNTWPGIVKWVISNG